VPYKTLLLSVRDTAAQVVLEMLEKYGINKGLCHTLPPRRALSS
jgi:hypothetical protein